MANQGNEAFSDFLKVLESGNFEATGPVAQRLMQAGFNVNALRPFFDPETNRSYVMSPNGGTAFALKTNAATLRKDEWKLYDTAVVEAAVAPMRAVSALRAAGLVFGGSGSGLAKTVLEYEDMSDMTDAEMSMDGVTRGNNDRIQYTIKYLPLFLTHKSFFINARTLAASRSGSSALDTTQASIAGRKIGESIENTTVNGCGSLAFGGGTIFGLTDFTYRQTLAMAKDWAICTGREVKNDVLAMVKKAMAHNFYGPYILLISGDCEAYFNDDYTSNYQKTILARIKEISSIAQVEFVPFLNKTVATAQAILIHKSQDVFRMVDALPVTNVEWQTEGGMQIHYKAMTIQVPQPRADQANKCGIVHCKAGL